MGPGQPGSSPASPPPQPARAAAGQAAAVVVPIRAVAAEPEPEPEPTVAEPAPAPAPPPPPASGLAPGDWWAQLLDRLQLDGLLANLARHAMLLEREDNLWHLALDPGHQPMATDARVKTLADAISDYMGKPVKLAIRFESGGEDSPAQREERARQARLAHARETLRNDPVINTLVNDFGARLDEDSIEPS